VGPVRKCSLIRNQAVITPDDDADHDDEDADDRPIPKGRRVAKGYGFCKFTCQEDAITASQKLNLTSIQMEDGRNVKVWVEVSADATKTATTTNTTTVAIVGDNEAYLLLQAKKRTSRVILRNLSFYATERDICRVMEERFGKVVDINLPLVPNYRNKRKEDNGAGDGDDASKRRRQHRGFAFVTFDNPKNARLAVDSCAGGEEDVENATQVLIKKRPVAIDLSLPKVQHKVMLKEQKEKLEEEDVSDEQGSDEEEDGSDDCSTDDEDDNEGEEGSYSDSDSFSKESDIESDKPAPPVIRHDQTPRNALFLRNLPFDATRHDIFTAFYRFGHIEGIFIVKDRTTNINRGTAFVNYKTEEGCRKAILAASTRDDEGVGGNHDGGIEVKLGEEGEQDELGGYSGGGGLYINGRRILIDLAVDRKTAESLKVERDDEGKTLERRIGKDRRNIYLKGEGRVEGTDTKDNNDADAKAPKLALDDKDAWENLPEGDQLKRGRAHKDKHTKLRSPLFFINPFRLSIRNLNKGIDEPMLKALVVRGLLKGLEKGLVTRDDMKAHWRARGDMTTRDIVKKIAEIENDEDSGEEDKVIPTFDENRGVKNFVPSVYIDRDFAGASATTADTINYSNGLLLPLEEDEPSKSKTLPPSRGFGFVEFTEHAHALACLRELNNNVAYSSEFVAGGKKAIEIKRRIKNNGGLRKKQPMATLGDEGTKAEDFLGNDGRFKIPRLIVEFTVENKAKAKKQAERKALQFANVMKQKKSARQSLLEEELKEDNDDKNDDDVEKKVKQKMKKKSRGALQRERKRSKKEEGGEAALTDNDTACSNSALSSDTIKQIVCSTASQQKRDGVEREQQSKKRKKKDVHPIMEVTPQIATKPPKKKKKRTSKVEERDESAFEDMVRSYKKSLGGGGNRGDDIVVNTTIAKKNHVDGGAGRDSRNGRWFD